MPVDNRYDGRGENPPYKVGNEIHGMDEWLFERYQELKAIHERLEDAVRLAAYVQDDWAPMFRLVDDVRLMRDRAKAEYEAF